MCTNFIRKVLVLQSTSELINTKLDACEGPLHMEQNLKKSILSNFGGGSGVSKLNMISNCFTVVNLDKMAFKYNIFGIVRPILPFITPEFLRVTE